MIPNGFEKLAGQWAGTNRLHTSWIPEDPIKDSISKCSVRTVAMGQFLEIEYSWEYQGAPQSGLMILGSPKNGESVDLFFLDSWHLNNLIMNCAGKADGNIVSVKGFYKVPDHPDWGWRTDIDCGSGDSFTFTMFNVSPDGDEDLAVESTFQKA